MKELTAGDAILWRIKGQDRAYTYGYVASISGDLVQVGAYRGHMSGTWYDVSEIEWREYPK
jgi:hypothetical protein